MDFEDIIDGIWEVLPERLINDKSLEEIKQQMLDFVSDLSEEVQEFFSFSLNLELLEEIHLDLDDEERIDTIYEEDSGEIFSVEFGYGDLFFSIKKDNNKYKVSFLLTEEDEYTHETVVDLVIGDELTSCSKLSTVMDDREYYYDYKREYYSLDKNDNLVILKNIDELLDMDFSEFFGVPLSKARKLRTNYDKNIKYINDSLASKNMEIIDEVYSKDFIVFRGPFLMEDFKSLILGSELLEVENATKDRVEKIVNNIIKVTDILGEFVITHNLLVNIQSYVFLEYDVLNTSGYMIRRLDGEYIIFNINITHNGVLIIPSSVNKDYLLYLYNSSGNSEHDPDLDEFFGMGNNKKLN